MKGRVRSDAEQSMLGEFEISYRNATAPVVQAIERRVCGCDYGGTSYTTRDQAEGLADVLALAPGKALLEVGAGAGWPSLYLAKLSGCNATLTDLPAEALRAASERARKDGIAERCTIIEADGTGLPFEHSTFDAISHSDVLCCLPEKLAVLRECRRVVKSSGRMAFFVIYVPSALSTDDRAAALSAGPAFVASDGDYESLLRNAGWRLVSRCDVTESFQIAMQRLVEAREHHADELAELVGRTKFLEALDQIRQKLPAIRRRLLERALFVVEPL
jgi:ubiquinone/menaquinone biosynthesis C-methylase UbiE